MPLYEVTEEGLEDLVVHEDRYWAATADGLGTDETLPRRVVALATLAGADTEPESFEGFAPQRKCWFTIPHPSPDMDTYPY